MYMGEVSFSGFKKCQRKLIHVHRANMKRGEPMQKKEEEKPQALPDKQLQLLI